MNKAIFLDRDGVINKLIFNIERKEYEPPHSPDDLELVESAIESLKSFSDYGYKLFIVSNQPDYAKGKTSFQNLLNVQDKFHKILIQNKIFFTEYYYCYHHPMGIIPEYSIDCKCRKPKSYFVLRAIDLYQIDPKSSWFVGDTITDIECGYSAGLKTILIKDNQLNILTNIVKSSFIAFNIKEASEIILKNEKISV